MKKKVSRVRSLYNRLDDVRSHHVDRELILLNRLIEAEALLSRWLEMARSSFDLTTISHATWTLQELDAEIDLLRSQVRPDNPLGGDTHVIEE